jgi:hypothetical protein
MHGCSLGGTFVLHPRAQPIESALPEQPIRQLAQAAFVDIIPITVACALAEVATDVISAAEQPEAHIWSSVRPGVGLSAAIANECGQLNTVAHDLLATNGME